MLNDGKNRVYSFELKQQIIDEVLLDKQRVYSTVIKYGLSSSGMLVNWIKSYKDNDN